MAGKPGHDEVGDRRPSYRGFGSSLLWMSVAAIAAWPIATLS